MGLKDVFHVFGGAASPSPATGPTKADTELPPCNNFLRIIVNPTDSDIDIVAVHGLNPLNAQSHAEATWTSEGKLWLSDFLPKRLPRARICLFGYNSNIAFGSSAAGVREQGENVLNHLEQIRAALVHAKVDSTYRTIWESTFGLVFFGTPHQGGSNAGFGDTVAGIARCLSRSPRNTFMDALKGNSLFLSTITDDFRQLLEDFQVLSFYETRPLGRFGIVVDRKSALLGLPGTRERQIPVDADHSGICKFASIEDPRYILVEDNIAWMVSNATSHALERCRKGEEAGTDAGNTSHISGASNKTIQVGYANQSMTDGNSNATDQLGDRNRSDVLGTGNTVTQVSMGATGILLLGQSSILHTPRVLTAPTFPTYFTYWQDATGVAECGESKSSSSKTSFYRNNGAAQNYLIADPDTNENACKGMLSALGVGLALGSMVQTCLGSSIPPTASCSSLTVTPPEGATLINATAIERYNVTYAGPTYNGVAKSVDICDVEVFLTHGDAGDAVRFSIYLPLAGWNGRWQGTGGGGFAAGGFDFELVPAVSSGYSAGATDAGVPLDGNTDVWYNSTQLVENFGAY
ncbi:hypothetical protein O1611_g3021 [Lasiodiplodia mahajangana]|uniref:Uncharacterized protein n=1 Tax=Lasiodiplodia mahajangana TaxID=1108764 RepID=A0ACC2JTD3_9PEZI|nr:hypothetical protein O1611_g3021 [Lasiodiplodia mahajangana]